MNLRDSVHKLAKQDIKKETKLSFDWYQKNVRDAAARMSTQKFLGDNVGHQISKGGITPGDMIFYFYSPKHKDTLPYYDTSPLVMPFSISEDGKSFYGLNLHYLHPAVRAGLLEDLMAFVNDDKLSRGTKIKASWSMIKKAAGSDLAEHCVKQYLFTHVKSQVVVIPPKEWKYVVWLPLCTFVKAENETVWKDN